MKYLTLGQQRDGLPVPVQREVTALKALQGHSNILRYHGLYQNVRMETGRWTGCLVTGFLCESNHRIPYFTRNHIFMLQDFGVSIVLEYLPNSLGTILKQERPESSWVVNVVFQILKGLEACHQHGIVHRDISPNNILVDDSCVVKLADFGISISQNEVEKSVRESNTPGMGTLWYMAPEILLGSTMYTAAVDIWSVGCVIVEIVLGQPPFKGRSDLHQLCSIIDVLGTPDESSWPGLSEQLPDWGKLEFKHVDAKDWNDVFRMDQIENPASKELLSLAKKMIVFNPNNRISAAEALQSNVFHKI